MSMITPDLIEAVRKQYVLNWEGIHGIGHWERVSEVGSALAAKTGADLRVVELFAYLHDACRLDDGFDPGHGHRSAEFALSLRGRCFELPDDKFDLLIYAIRSHSGGRLDARVEVGTCWDADRLDLGRVAISPHPDYLSMAAAREAEFFKWAKR